MYGAVRQQQFQSSGVVPNNIGPLAQLQQMNPHQPPPPPPTQPVSVQPPTLSQSFLEKLQIGLEHAPPAFNLREQVLGAGGANLQYIRKETGVQITLRGVGSLFGEPITNTESPEPLHLLIEHQRYENLNSAKQLAKNLIETLHQEFLQFQQATGAAGSTITQVTQTVPPQLSVPPPNVIASLPPPVTPLVQPHQQISVVQQQQFIPQNGLQMQQMHIQQQQPSAAPNLSIPPPPAPIAGQSNAVATMPTIKQPNQIQLQFHQPPPPVVSQQAPIILNTQQPSIQYQYIQQTTRDMQGNQQVTLQPIIHQTHLPMPSHQQQYITVQQGNTAYMVPQSTIIQQAQPGTQLSFIQPMTQQTTSQYQMQMPLLNVQSAGNTLQQYSPVTLQNIITRGELKTDMLNDASASTSTFLEQDTLADSNSLEDANIVTDSINDGSSDMINQQILRQPPPGIPITSIPPPPINMSVPPPAQHFVGNTLVSGGNGGNGNTTMLQQHQIINATTPSGQQQQQHILGNTNSTNWTAQTRAPPPPLGQPITDLQQMQSTTTTQTIGQQPQQQQVAALTFTQQPIMQTGGQITQQYLQLQQQPQMQQHMQQQQQQQQHYSIIQTTPINNANVFQQQQPQLLQFQTVQSHLLQQQQLQYQQQQQQQQIQYQVQQQQQQQQLRQQAQSSLDSTNQTVTNVRSSQKRRSTSEVENSTAGPTPNQQPRAGMGPQSNLNNNGAVASTLAITNNAGNSFTLTETDGAIGQDNLSAISNLYTVSQTPQQTQQHPQQQNLKTTHIGLMRYNQDHHRVNYEAGHPLPRERLSNYHSSGTTVVQQLNQQNYQQQPQQRMQFVHTQPPPPLPNTIATYRAVLNSSNVNNGNNSTGYGQRRLPRP